MIKAILLFAICIVGIFMTACTKDEQTYRRIDGNYTVSSIEIKHYNFCRKSLSLSVSVKRKDSTIVYYENVGEY